jgi:hypothetical protein
LRWDRSSQAHAWMPRRMHEFLTMSSAAIPLGPIPQHSLPAAAQLTSTPSVRPPPSLAVVCGPMDTWLAEKAMAELPMGRKLSPRYLDRAVPLTDGERLRRLHKQT